MLEIEDIPKPYVDLLDSMDQKQLVMCTTYFSYRIGFSDYFIDNVLLSELQSDEFKMLVPIWNNRDKPLYGASVQLSSSQEDTLQLVTNKPEEGTGQVVYFDNKTQLGAAKLIEYVLEKYKFAEANQERQHPLIVFVEVFGPIKQVLVDSLRHLMSEGPSKRITLWLHSEVANTPIDLLDQFQNQIIFLPSIREKNQINQIKPIRKNTQIKQDGQDRRYEDEREDILESGILAASGLCVNRYKTWKVIECKSLEELRGIKQSRFAENRDRYLKSILAIYLNGANDLAGTGFIVKYGKLRYGITCAHVLSSLTNGESVKVAIDSSENDTKYDARVIHTSPKEGAEWIAGLAEEDIAVLDISTIPNSAAKVLKISRETILPNQEDCFCFCFSHPDTIRGAWFEQIKCGYPVKNGFIELWQYGSRQIKGGGSGAPLCGPSGEVIGMIQSIGPQGKAYLVPRNLIYNVIRNLVRKDKNE